MQLLLQLLAFALPWSLRRIVLQKWCGCELAEGSSIGLSLVLCRRVKLGRAARIGHFNFLKNCSLVELGDHAIINNLNWITGFPKIDSPHFAAEPDRAPELILGRHSSITNRHLIDCTARVTIGSFTTFAGFRSQILTHTIDIIGGRQTSRPLTIGDYCFIGTDCILLGGSALPSHSVLGAKSLLNKIHLAEYRLYGGVPAKELSELPADAKYFTRATGFVE
ncbi:MAG: acyltransferase [Chthoniobacterales bacterium]